ncbi:serine/threonine-protein kinase [Streptomyces sp. So13.3]|uniref:serine/threonine-protein kinase n=1 Tax=Streptomyces TaxID=1883 RepID=UPI001105E756|nr:MULTISPECIES: protein kinase [Streptomyces]MCZ4096920.1 protein kinase [Streptomyces sp. H39-C1]QNA70766.1 serine/threonine-protein kinase [Streptomyces sp. So13.3]
MTTPRDPREALRTRLENTPQVPAEALRTRLEPGPSEPSAEPEMLTVLPRQLAARFRLLSELPAAGAEANLMVVADDQGRELVAKIYRRSGQQASRQVWAEIPRLANPYIVRVLETGEAGQRDFELMEYVRGGNLAQFVGHTAVGDPAALVTEMVRQISSALSALHGVGIIHQDLKPENVLVRSRSPLDLALSDFGVSRVLDQTRAEATAAGTLAYLAPELLLSSGGQTSRARDWWALGMMARELLLGQRPFEDMVKPAIDAAVMLRGIDLDGVTDPRLRMLCAGLLTRDPEDRWGASQVESWLAGGSPVVAYTAPPAGPHRTKDTLPLVLRSVRYTTPEDLATALCEKDVWNAAARSYFTGMGPAHQPSEGWRALRRWLRQFDDPDQYDVEELQDLVDHQLTDPSLGPDARVLRLLRTLAPQTPAMCRGLRIDRENLLVIARHALAAPTAADDNLQLVEALWHQNLLAELSACPASSELGRINTAWHADHQSSGQVLGGLRQSVPPAAQQTLSAAPDARTVLAPLLCLLLGTQEDATGLWMQLDQVSTRTAAVGWFTVARGQAGGGHGALVALRQLVPAALAETEQTERRIAAAEATRRAQAAHWAYLETQRTSTDAVSAATVRAVGSLALYGLGMVVLAMLGAQAFDTAETALPSLVIGVVMLLIQIVLEVALAREVGAEYARGYTLFSQAGSGFRRAGQHRGAGYGCLVIILAPVVLSVLVTIPAVIYAVLLTYHLRSLSRRRALWRGRYAAAYARVVSQR